MDLAVIYEMLEPIVESHDMELYDIETLTEYGRFILRIYIDKEEGAGSSGGVTIDDCEKITYAVQPALDSCDQISGSYILEVSSPGIERKLVKDSHYAANIGNEVEVRLNKPFNMQKKFRGVLVGLSEEAVIINSDNSDENIQLPRESLAYCRLIYKERNHG